MIFLWVYSIKKTPLGSKVLDLCSLCPFFSWRAIGQSREVNFHVWSNTSPAPTSVLQSLPQTHFAQTWSPCTVSEVSEEPILVCELAKYESSARARGLYRSVNVSSGPLDKQWACLLTLCLLLRASCERSLSLFHPSQLCGLLFSLSSIHNVFISQLSEE